MSLLDRLRELENFPSSHQPALHEVLTLVGKLVAYTEHGDKLFEQEDNQGLADLLSGAPKEEPPADVTAPAADQAPPVSASAPTAPARSTPATSPLGVGVPGGASSTDDRDTEIASLRQQVETLRAQQNRTEATVEPDPPTPTASVDPAAS